jgi:hypothetical protein
VFAAAERGRRRVFTPLISGGSVGFSRRSLFLLPVLGMDVTVLSYRSSRSPVFLRD